ncbi:MAG: virulence protein RhuM/Fic/DOC family protein [Patescibacteria group bacterium]
MINEIVDNKAIIYQSEDGGLKLPMFTDQNSVWLILSDIAKLYEVDKKTIQQYVQEIINEDGLEPNQTRKKLLHTTKNNRKYLINHYNLDIIMNVGYKLNSQKAIEFRKWTTRKLKNYITDGYLINSRALNQNPQKLLEAQKSIRFILANSNIDSLDNNFNRSFLDLITDYTKAFLNSKNPQLSNNKKAKSPGLNNYLKAVVILKKDLVNLKEASNAFGQQYGDKFSKIIHSIEERFNGAEIYSSLAEKASLLFYLIIKNKPFVEGNKRIASFLLLYLLDFNDSLFDEAGEQKISDSSLKALSILISSSKEKDKDIILTIIGKLACK